MVLKRSLSIVILGCGGVGKTCIVQRYISGKFQAKYDPTIEDTYRAHKEVEGKAYSLDIVDTAGQEGFVLLVEALVKDGDAFIVAFALDNRDTFEFAFDKFYNIIWKKNVTDETRCPIVFMGNKCDLEDDRTVSFKEATNQFNELGCQYFETSAKTGKNVAETFNSIVKAWSLLHVDGDILTKDTRSSREHRYSLKVSMSSKHRCILI